MDMLLQRDRLDETGPAPADITTRTLTVQGHVPQAVRRSLQDLRTLTRHELGPIEIQCFTGREVARLRRCAGVRLVDVLDSAGFSTLPRAERKRCVIAARGEDDYLALFTWCELYNSAAGEQVLVLYERDDRPPGSDGNPFDLLAGADLRLGPRHLRGLCAIDVRLF